jgi:DNA invertase Pin-like site-specific DNA recombinase
MDKQGLRFAAIVRVSTEKQAKQGESLNVQRKQIEEAAKYLGGEVKKWCSGHEHATPDYERKLLDELMREVKEKPKENFDAIMVYNTSRWSRDTLKNAEDIKILRDNGIRYFALTHEVNLYDPRDILLLTVDVAFNNFKAQEIKIASIHSKIARAQKNEPSSGRKVFGRIFKKKTGNWYMDKKKKAMVEEWAKLYLEEDISFRKLGELYGKSYTNIRKILTERCGTKWFMTFKDESLNKYIPVELKIPRLLDESTIQRIKEKCEARKKWEHGFQKYLYLLSRIIFDESTGHALTGSSNNAGKRYYRLFGCNGKTLNVDADEIEGALYNSFFEALGWNKSLSDTMFEKFPTIENTEKLNNEKKIYKKELKSFENKQTNIINVIADYKSDDKGSSLCALKTRLRVFDERIAELKFKIQAIENQLLVIPTKQEISDRLEQFKKELLEIEKGIIEDHKMSYVRGGNIFHDLPFIEKQKLIRLIFGGRDELGKRYGIYVKHIDGEHKKYEFMAYGRLGNIKGRIGGNESYSYSDDDIYISDYPEEIKKGIRKIVSVIDNNKERLLSQN